MRLLPVSPFEACDQASTKVTAQSLVCYKTNDYSMPVAYGHQGVWVRGYFDKVVIGCRGEIIALHARSWECEDIVFDPVHYLPLIEQKINSLDQAAPLRGWDRPGELATLRRLMEGRMAKHVRREYMQHAIDIPVVGIDFMVKASSEPDYVFIEANERPDLANHEPQPAAARFLDLLFPGTRTVM